MKYLSSIAFALLLSVAALSAFQSSALAQSKAQSQERIYKRDEVTVTAKITKKALPSYTEEARRNRTSGTVILEMVLRASGEVTDIIVIQGLPHGLNDMAVRAAKGTKFEPATKDDQKVSQYARIEYGFYLY
ncbi:MAG: hypothetical protein QOD75_2891 [Blastocatellia bacterium]|nr:hypothetical protein [Blastocatellia bacterium]